MIDPNLIEVAKIGGAVLGVIGVRGLFARAAIEVARRKATPAVEAFKQDNTHVKPLADEFRGETEVLLDTIHSSRQMRIYVKDQARQIKMPDPDLPELLPDLKMKMKKANVSFKKAISKTWGHKTKKLFKGQLKHRLHEAHGVVKSVAPHLSGTEQHIIDVMDGFGAIDLAQHGAEAIHQGLGEVFSEHTRDQIETATDEIVDALAVPGLVSGAKTVFREFNLLMDDQTSFGDTMQYGLVPLALKSGLKSIGLALDAATGWASLGLFTITASVLGKFLHKSSLVDKINDQIGVLKEHIGIVQKQQKESLDEINKATTSHLKDFSAQVNNCPDIGDEMSLRDYVQELHTGFKTGLITDTKKVAENTQAEIEKLPKRNWVDKALFIDRPKEVAALYLQAQREVTSQSIGVAHKFAMAVEAHPENVVSFLLKHSTFQNPETIEVLKKTAQVTVASADEYAASLTTWEGECTDVWNKGMATVTEVTAREHKKIKVVVAREEKVMKPAREKIKQLKLRLSKKAVA